MGNVYSVGVQQWITGNENQRPHWDTLAVFHFGKDYQLAIALSAAGVKHTYQPPFPDVETDTGWSEEEDDPAGSEFATMVAVLLGGLHHLPPPQDFYEVGHHNWGLYAQLVSMVNWMDSEGIKHRILIWHH